MKSDAAPVFVQTLNVMLAATSPVLKTPLPSRTIYRGISRIRKRPPPDAPPRT